MELIITIIFATLIGALFAVVFGRALYFKSKKRKLAEPIRHYSEEEELAYAKQLAQWLQCATISRKDAPHDDIEFKKLRDINALMFPNLHNYAKLTIFSDDCWMYLIPGVDVTRQIMLMSHHDVVEATGEWSYPPFSGTIADGAVWGRGTVDTKTPLFAEMTALEELLAAGEKPSVNVYIGSSHNEEICGDGIPLALEYFKTNNIRFELIIDEGGAIIAPPLPGMTNKCAMLATHEKGRLSASFRTINSARHDGLQFKDKTPIERMSQFINEVSTCSPFIRFFPREVKAMFNKLCPYLPFALCLVFSNLWLFGGLLKKIMPSINPTTGAMLGTTCKFNSIIGGKENKGNETECLAKAFIQCIYREELDIDLKSLKKIADMYGIEISIESNEYHEPSNMDTRAFQVVENAVQAVFPHVITSPFILPAGSDSRHLVGICDTVVRFAPIDIDNQQFASVHGVDENISLTAVANAVAFYKTLVRNYK